MASLYGSRAHTFIYELLDQSDRLVSPIDGIKSGGRISNSLNAVIRTTGEVPAAGPAASIDWGGYRLRISYQLPPYQPVPLVTAIVQVPEDQHSASGMECRLSFGDKLLIPNRDRLTSYYTLPKGANIVNEARSLLGSCGVADREIIIPDADKTLSLDSAWKPGTTKLKIINQLLDSAGYWPLWCDGLGRFRSSKYVEQGNRPEEWNFADDPTTGLYLPEWTLGRKVDIPNRYVCTARSAADALGDDGQLMTSVAESEAGFEQLGYWLTESDDDVDAADQETLDIICARKLAEARSTYETVTFTHPWIPGFADGPEGLNKIATFAHSRMGKVVRGRTERQDWSLDEEGLIETVLRGYL